MKALEAPPAWRQSSIASFESCALRLRFELESEQRQGPSWRGYLDALGTLGHRWFAVAINHMRAHGEREIAADMMMELGTEVMAQRDVPDEDVVHLPMREMRWLRALAMKWCHQHTFSIERIKDVEEQLSATITVPGPRGTHYERTITGRPDVLLAGPAEGEATILDWKTGWAPPPKQREPTEGEPPREDRLSAMGYPQLIVYGWLVLKEYPSVERVTEWEHYVRHDEFRKATVWRSEMEQIEDVLAATVSQMDAAVEAGPDSARWIPGPGTHCGFCPRVLDCPIRQEVGIPANDADAVDIAREWIVSGERRKNLAPLLKGYVDKNGPIPIDHGKGRREVGWAPNKTGDGQSFRLYEPDEVPAENPLDAILEGAARGARA